MEIGPKFVTKKKFTVHQTSVRRNEKQNRVQQDVALEKTCNKHFAQIFAIILLISTT